MLLEAQAAEVLELLALDGEQEGHSQLLAYQHLVAVFPALFPFVIVATLSMRFSIEAEDCVGQFVAVE